MLHLTSRLRTVSIKQRLWTLLLLISMVMVVMGGFVISNSVNMVVSQLRQSGQQQLYAAATQMRDIREEAFGLTKYPVMADVYGSTEIYHYLEQSPREFYAQIYYSLQAEFYSELMLHPRVDLLGVADLQGQMIYCCDESINYRVTDCDASSAMYTHTLSLWGAPYLFTAEEARTLLPKLSVQQDTLYCARAVMKLNHLAAVGLFICRLPLHSIRSAFEANRLFDTQRLSILAEDGTVLYGDGTGLPLDDPAALPASQLTAQADWQTRTLYQFYRLPGDCVACLSTPLASLYPLLKAHLLLLIGLPLFIAAVLIVSRRLTRSIQEPIDKLMDVCVRIQHEDFATIEDSGANDEMHRLIESFNLMSAHIQNLIEEVYKKNLLQAQTEMQLVRSQINPHFVYNTLETIRAEAYTHGQYAIADMTTLLGKTLHYGVSHQGDCVTVAQELSHLQDYIALQQMRLGCKLNVIVTVPPELRDCYMIRLSLQPLVENAIHHGLPTGEKSGRICVLGYEKDGDLFFSISDNGKGIPPEEVSHLQEYIWGENSDYTSIGLKNPHCRLELFFGKPYGLSLRSVPGQGTSVTLRMPLRREPFDLRKEPKA